MDKLKTYLVGSIQDEADGGVDWREKVGVQLTELGFEVQDPTKAECNNSLANNIEDQKKKLENLKRGGAWDKYDEVMGNIRQSDLVCVNNSKFLVVSYDPSKRIGGTVHEIVEAWGKGIPIYTVSYSAIMDFNDWILSLLRDNFNAGGMIFPNFKQCVEHIEKEYKDYIKEIKDANNSKSDKVS